MIHAITIATCYLVIAISLLATFTPDFRTPRLAYSATLLDRAGFLAIGTLAVLVGVNFA